MPNSFDARSTLQVGDQTFHYYRLDTLNRSGLEVSRLPFSLKILLENLLRHEDVIAHRINTGFVEEHMQELHVSGADVHQQLYFSHAEEDGRNVNTPMAALWELQGPEGTVSITAPHRGMIVSVDVQVGDPVHTGQQVAVLEAMKMEFIVEAASSGVVRAVAASVGDTLSAGQALLFIEPADAAVMREEKTSVVDIDAIRPDLQEVRARHAIGLDELRPDAVERRRRNGQRTVRENIADLCDPVRCADARRPAQPAFLGGIDQAQSGGRPGGWSRECERRVVPRRAVTLYGVGLRLHSIRRNARHHESQEDRPATAPRSAMEVTHRPLRRGRRWASRRHGLVWRSGSRQHDVHQLREVKWTGTAGGDRFRALFRWECCAARLL